MPLESGGRADKQGNRYEISCITYELLKIVSEENSSVVIETSLDKGTQRKTTENELPSLTQCTA